MVLEHFPRLAALEDRSDRKKCSAPHRAPLPTVTVPPRCRDTNGIGRGPQGAPTATSDGSDERSGASRRNPGMGKWHGKWLTRGKRSCKSLGDLSWVATLLVLQIHFATLAACDVTGHPPHPWQCLLSPQPPSYPSVSLTILLKTARWQNRCRSHQSPQSPQASSPS